MHRALQIPEVLLNIFCHCTPSKAGDYKSVKRDLAALARTCRAFKEPALDILWSVLGDPTPLSRCLPEVSHYEITQNLDWPHNPIKFYTFSRPLERAEWDILRSYARRVWLISNTHFEFDWEFVRRTSMDFTPAEPLFPNLRSLYCEFTKETIPLLLLPFPSLMRIDIQLPSELDLCTLLGPIRSLAETSPNIRKLDIWSSREFTLAYPAIVSDAIYSWSNLRRLFCSEFCLDVDNFIHLSRIPTLTDLSCTLGTTFLAHTMPSGPLSFSALDYLGLHSFSLVLISRLLSWAWLPSITNLSISVENCPSKKELTSFMASLQTGMGHAVRRFSLEQVHDAPDTIPPREPDAPLLDLDDLRPCMAFHDLLSMRLDLQWDVDLSDDKLLTLTSSWPRLEVLVVNTNWGWNRPGGISPYGLASLLQMCPSLMHIALAIDTRGFIQSPDRKYQKPIAIPYPDLFNLNVLDSVIEQESVDAMGTFLSSIVPHVDFTFTVWEAWSVLDHPDYDLYQERWSDVYRQANNALKERLARAR